MAGRSFIPKIFKQKLFWKASQVILSTEVVLKPAQHYKKLGTCRMKDKLIYKCSFNEKISTDMCSSCDQNINEVAKKLIFMVKRNILL